MLLTEILKVKIKCKKSLFLSVLIMESSDFMSLNLYEKSTLGDFFKISWLTKSLSHENTKSEKKKLKKTYFFIAADPVFAGK